MRVCSKCFQLHGARQLHCPACRTRSASSEHFMRHRITTHKTGRLRTRPSKVYSSLTELR